VKIYDYDSNPRYDYYRDYMERFPKEKRYNEYLKQDTKLEEVTNKDYPNAVEIYRRTLSEQPDCSVTICIIGYLTAIEQLLKSDADIHSDLNGYELVKRKVKKIVTMSDIPFLGEGSGSFNWDMDFEAAQYVINHSPCPICISGYGKTVLTGKKLLAETTGENPVCKAYKRYLLKYERQVSSWDQIAILYAVKGEGVIFTERKGYTLNFDDNQNKFIWKRRIEGRSDVFVDINISDTNLAEIIEELMVYEPKALN
jgi:inosine-uridine nucleoside N-ribohydrolase